MKIVKRLWKENGLKQTPWYFSCSSNSWISWLTRSIWALSLDLPDPEDGNFFGGFAVTPSWPTEASPGTPSGSKSLGLSWDPSSDCSSSASSSTSLSFSPLEARWLSFFSSLRIWNNLRTLGSLAQPQGTREKLEVRFQVYRYACRQAYEKMQHIFRCPLQGSWHTRIYIACHKTCGYDSFLRACTTLYECSSMIKTAYIHLHVYYACLGMYASIPTSNSVLFVCVNVCLLIFTWSCMYLSVFACVILHAGMACTILHARMPAYMDGWMDLWMHEWLKNEHIMSYMDPAWYLNTNLCMRIWGCMHVYMNQLCDSAFGPWMICIFI